MTGTIQAARLLVIAASLCLALPAQAVSQNTHAVEHPPTKSLSLREALSLSLSRSPALLGAAHTRDAQEGLLRQAALWPSPGLAVEIENVAGSGVNGGAQSAETTVTLSQLVELGGKRAARMERAGYLKESAAWDYEVRRIAILSLTAEVFAELLGFQEHVEHAGEAVELIERYVHTAEERARAGAASPAEALRAKIALEEARLELESGRRSASAGRRRLAALWGDAAPHFEVAQGDLTVIPEAIPSLEEIHQRMGTSPELKRWQAEAAARESELRLAQAQVWPDLVLSGGYRRHASTDTNAFVFGVSLPIPLTDRNQGTRAESTNLALAAKAKAIEVRSVLAAGLAQTHAVIENTHAQAIAIRERMLPDARRAFEIMNDGYRRGRFSLIEVMDAQRTLFEIVERYHLTLVDFHRGVAEFERIAGIPLIPGSVELTEPSPRGELP